MVLVDVSILAEEDDWQVKHVTGGEYTAEYNLSNATWYYQRFGTPASDFTGSRVFYLFRGITIPQGSTIFDATLIIPQLEVNGATPMPMSIRAVNNSAPTNLADYSAQTGTGPAFNTPVLTPVVTFSPTDSIATDYPVDVKDHVQALVNAFDYSNDNMLFRMAKTPVTTTVLNFDAQNFEYQVSPPDTSANLTINYSDCASDFCEDFNEYALSKLPVPREIFNYSTKALADLAWTSQDEPDNQVDVVNENFFFTIKRDGTNRGSSIDLGKTVSDERWTLRCKVVIGTPYTVTSSLSSGFSIGLEDTDSSAGIGFLNNSLKITLINTIIGGGSQHQNVSLFEGAGNGIEGTTTGWTAGDIRYIELKRLSRTEYQTTIYTDANYSVILDRLIKTIPAGVTGLRFIKIGGPTDNEPTYNGVFTGIVDDIEFWNEGSQGDITFQDNFVQKAVTFGDDFSSYGDQGSADTAWVPQDVSFMRVNITNDNLEWNSTVDGTNNSIAHDLGSTVNDEQWALRFKYTSASLTLGSSTGKYIWFGLFDSDGTVASETTQDALAFYITVATGGNSINLAQRDGVILSNAGTNSTLTTVNTASDTFFVELARTSATSAKLTLYSDSTYETVIESTTLTIPAGITGLRYIAIKNRNIATTTGSMNGTIDDVEFYNGNSTLTDWSGATGNDVGLDIINERINFDPPTGVARDELVAFDLQTILDGSNASDENWTLRFKIITDTLVQGSSEESASLLVGLDNNLDSTTTGTHNIILFRSTMDQGGAGPQFGAISSSLFREGGEYFTGGTGGATQFPIAWSTGTRFVEVKRLSPTLMQTTLFTDASFREIEKNSSGVPLTVQDTIPSTLVDLRYIRVTTESSAVANDTSYDGAIDDIEFYNGVSVPRTPIEEVKDFEDTFVDDNWDDTGTGVEVNTSTQVIDWTSVLDSVAKATVFDLGAGNVNDTKWALRFKYRIDTLTAGSTRTKFFWIGLFDSDQTVDSESVQDYIGLSFFVNSTLSVGNFSLSERDNVILTSAGTDNAFTTTPTDQLGNDLYVEVRRTSDTLAICSLYSDPDYSILIERVSLTVPAGITDLRYIGLKNRTDPVNTGSMTGIVDDVEFWNGQAGLDHQNKWRKVDL